MSGAKSVRIRRDTLPDHPWIYGKQVRDAEPGTRSGDPVRIVSAKGEPLGSGLYHGRSQIGIRVLTRDPKESIDARFLARRVDEAVALRRKVLRLDERTNAWRVLNSEGDGLSGIVVDRYADWLSVQIKCLGMFRLAPEIGEILARHFPGARTVYRRDEQGEKIEGFKVPPHRGEAVASIAVDGLKYRVDLVGGHKTGTFLDQRDNRVLAGAVAKGRRVLDLFCYDGAFALACARGGAASVRAVDLDEKAAARARANAKANRLDVAVEHADAFDVLRARPKADFVLLDPPRWISSRGDEEAGRRRYLDLNALAIEGLPDGGLLATSSCSGRLSADAFLGILRGAAARAGRSLRILTVAGAAPDHPVAADFPEGHYLTFVLARVGR